MRLSLIADIVCLILAGDLLLLLAFGIPDRKHLHRQLAAAPRVARRRQRHVNGRAVGPVPTRLERARLPHLAPVDAPTLRATRRRPGKEPIAANRAQVEVLRGASGGPKRGLREVV